MQNMRAGGEKKGGKIIMKTMHNKMHREEMVKTGAKRPSPLELIKKTGGVAHPVKTVKGERAPDSMLAVYRDRCTYTFIMDNEVASIHFDRGRKEIFFKGHNILNIALSPGQLKALKVFQDVLASDEQGKLLFNDYTATLGNILADKYK